MPISPITWASWKAKKTKHKIDFSIDCIAVGSLELKLV